MASYDGWMMGCAMGYLASGIGGTLWVALCQHHWQKPWMHGNLRNQGFRQSKWRNTYIKQTLPGISFKTDPLR